MRPPSACLSQPICPVRNLIWSRTKIISDIANIGICEKNSNLIMFGILILVWQEISSYSVKAGQSQMLLDHCTIPFFPPWPEPQTVINYGRLNFKKWPPNRHKIQKAMQIEKIVCGAFSWLGNVVHHSSAVLNGCNTAAEALCNEFDPPLHQGFVHHCQHCGCHLNMCNSRSSNPF